MRFYHAFDAEQKTWFGTIVWLAGWLTGAILAKLAHKDYAR